MYLKELQAHRRCE